MTTTLHPVDASQAYQLADFMPLVGLKRHGIRAARKRASELGITLVRYLHGKAYVLGADWLAYLEAATKSA